MARLSLLTLITIILISTASAQFMTGNCSLAKAVFGAPDTLTLRNRTNMKSPYCTSLNATCCTENDFNAMYNEWENPKNNNTLRKIRTDEMRQLVLTVRYLKDAQKSITELADLIKKAKYTSDPACLTPAHLQTSIQELNLVQTSLDLFEITAKRCWEFTKNQMNAMMCAACDPATYLYYEERKKVIQITDAECNSFIDACGEHIQAMQSITFYYNVIYRLSFCNEKGGFTEEKIPLSVSLPQKTEKAVVGCMNIRNKDDCAEVCKSQYGYTTMINYEYNNLKNMAEFAARVKALVDQRTRASQTNSEPPKTAIIRAAKRLRRRALQSLNVGFLNNLTVIVMKQGVEFSKYTFNNSDGYTDMQLEPVFKNSIIVSVLTSLLLLPILTV